MKLYVNRCLNCNRRIYLANKAPTRNDLRMQIGFNNFYVRCNHCQYNAVYNTVDVTAEAETQATATGAIVGGLVGLLGGPIGLIIGGGLGAAIGNTNDNEENARVRKFNSSW